MRHLIAVTGLAVIIAIGFLGLLGGMDVLAQWAQNAQRLAHDQMAASLRALRAGAPGALVGLWGLCFAYGFVHAIGPGHGKIVMGAYGIGTDSSMLHLAAVAMLAAFGQAVTAIALVFAGTGLLGLTRSGMEGVAQDWLDRAALFAVLAIGLWLALRGARALRRNQTYSHHSREFCASCGHSHAPDPVLVAQAGSWREMATLIGAISLRPCTGALFALILTLRMGLVWQGVGAVFAMALGTGLVTVTSAVLAGSARRGALRLPGLVQIAPVLELAAGAAVAVFALHMLNFI